MIRTFNYINLILLLSLLLGHPSQATTEEDFLRDFSDPQKTLVKRLFTEDMTPKNRQAVATNLKSAKDLEEVLKLMGILKAPYMNEDHILQSTEDLVGMCQEPLPADPFETAKILPPLLDLVQPMSVVPLLRTFSSFPSSEREAFMKFCIQNDQFFGHYDSPSAYFICEEDIDEKRLCPLLKALFPKTPEERHTIIRFAFEFCSFQTELPALDSTARWLTQFKSTEKIKSFHRVMMESPLRGYWPHWAPVVTSFNPEARGEDWKDVILHVQRLNILMDPLDLEKLEDPARQGAWERQQEYLENLGVIIRTLSSSSPTQRQKLGDAFINRTFASQEEKTKFLAGVFEYAASKAKAVLGRASSDPRA